MARHFSDKEAAAWLKTQPKKPISSKVILLNSSNELLLVKPNYKPGWAIVGGMVNANESPLQAAVREVREEVGVALPPERPAFCGVRYGVSKRSGDDYMHFLFKCQLTDDEVSGITIDTAEIEAFQWVEPQNNELEMNEHAYKLALEVIKNGTVRYSENDEQLV